MWATPPPSLRPVAHHANNHSASNMASLFCPNKKLSLRRGSAFAMSPNKLLPENTPRHRKLSTPVNGNGKKTGKLLATAQKVRLKENNLTF